MNGWQAGLLGGVLIGLAASLLLLSIGRIAGISGIAFGLFAAPRADRAWRAAFLLGMMASGAVALAVVPTPPVRTQTGSTVLLAVAGLLVGFGTRRGNGCTSGHGVCGVARGSRRSIAATGVFLGTGMLTVFLLRRGLGIA